MGEPVDVGSITMTGSPPVGGSLCMTGGGRSQRLIQNQIGAPR